MLTPQQAAERLAQFRLPDDRNRIAEEANKLPKALKEIANKLWRLEKREANFHPYFGWHDEDHEPTEQALLALSEKDLGRLFHVAAPAMAGHLAMCWKRLQSAPYQSGWSRKAFRAPGHPEASIGRRRQWLATIGEFAARYPKETLTAPWLAAWAPHLAVEHWGVVGDIGVLLASALDGDQREADEVFEILRQSLVGEHEIGAMERHIVVAFLHSGREEGWVLIEKTLLAAQRQEGLRQSILETIDGSHPQAFVRMLRIIIDQDLLRFAATVRAVDVWFGQLWAAASAGHLKKVVGQVLDFLEKPKERDKLLAGKSLKADDAERVFLALWCHGVEDAVASIAPARKLLAAKHVELRYVAARHLALVDLPPAAEALAEAIDDEDLRIAQYGLHCGPLPDAPSDRFERIEKLIERTPAKATKLPALVWPWTETKIERSDAAAYLAGALGDRPATRLIPHFDAMDSANRRGALEEIVKKKPWDGDSRKAIFLLAGDASEIVRQKAFEAIAGDALLAGEAESLEYLLRRKTSDLRRGVLQLLLKQPDELALASTDRLLASKDAGQRLGGLELLRHMSDKDRCSAECRERASAYSAGRKKFTKEEQSHLDEIAKEKVAVATLDDALGLMNLSERTPATPPCNLGTTFITPAAAAILKSLDALVGEHREETVEFKDYHGATQRELLGNMRYGFPSPDPLKNRQQQAKAVPLMAVWREWCDDRDDSQRDGDRLELLRARIYLGMCNSYRMDSWRAWAAKSPAHHHAAAAIIGGQELFDLDYGHIVHHVLDWLYFLDPIDARDYLLDAIETSWSLVPEVEMQRLAENEDRPKRQRWSFDRGDADWRAADVFSLWPDGLESALRLSDLTLTPEQRLRQWRLERWCDEPFPGAARRRVEPELLMDAYRFRGAAMADLADHLLGRRGADHHGYPDSFNLLSAWTKPKLEKADAEFLAEFPEARALVDRAVARIFEIELSRGDAPTPASDAAFAVRSIRGAESLLRGLQALGKAEFKLSSYWSSRDADRRQALTHLVQVTYPEVEEDAEAFVAAMKAAVKRGEFPEERLLQLTFLAPQWTKFIEAYYDWPHLSEALYWFLAHMHTWGGEAMANAALAAGEGEESEPEATSEGDEAGEESESSSSEPAESSSSEPAGSSSSEPAGSSISEPADESSEEASDEAAPAAPAKKLSAWERLMLERTPLSTEERRHGAIDVAWFQRTFALLGAKKWDQIAAAARFAATPAQAKRARYIGEVLLGKAKRKEIVDNIKKKQLKEHVRLLGLLPLAKGAKRDADLFERCRVLRDYRRYANTLSGLTKPDALRAWQIGLKNLAQTAGYADPMRLEWAVGADAVKDLSEGPATVTQGGVTVSLSLDEEGRPSIVAHRGEKELKSIPAPVKKEKKVAALLERFTDIKRQASSVRAALEAAMCRGDEFTGEELHSWCVHPLLAPQIARLVVVGEGILGYPDKQGKALRDCRGKLEPVKPSERLRFAHPFDLLSAGDWHEWQRDCFRAERVQPFKQVFRELYVLAGEEKKDAAVSHRYDGQQVQPKQAMALFGSRGWNTGEGVFKVFHDEGLAAEVHFSNFAFTPGEVEGWTVSGVVFRPRNEWTPLKLAAVPSRLFSEVMRDVDLVVSVAHAGGVAPEASASTVEMRASLLRETCDLLGLENVRFKASHALIDGEIANYSLHLGSGVVHKLPGGAVCIVSVHAQQRGRLFLPFADDDPKTAEIISKTLLLAKDREILDPSILEQLRR